MAVEKGRRPFGMLQTCGSVFGVRSYQMLFMLYTYILFICMLRIYIYINNIYT